MNMLSTFSFEAQIFNLPIDFAACVMHKVDTLDLFKL
jgi:hypothetical protein